ncbi:MAG: Fic family protein [Alphaproteobacteria bacterium]|nr:Fic family protein [Alphaproteobacteria bacterium]
MNLAYLTKLKSEIDSFRPLNADILENLSKWFEVELTYTSNAIEGNTLTRKETALVIEKGITVGGKTLTEHIEATNHKEALEKIQSMVMQKGFSIDDILIIHKIILKNIDDVNAGVVRNIPVRISGSSVILPNYQKVPNLLDAFVESLSVSRDHPFLIAIDAHFKFVSIHPFTDGNGRTGRLLMNLFLMQNGYPPIIISPKERLKYIQSLEKGQLYDDLTDYHDLMHKAMVRSFKIYLKAFKNKPLAETTKDTDDLLKIGALSQKTNESVATLRYWTKMGLLDVLTTTPSGYQLYTMDQVGRCRRIRELQKQRYTLEEILEKL